MRIELMLNMYVTYGIFFVYLLIVAIIDYKYHKIPNWLNISGFILGLFTLMFNPIIEPKDALIGSFAAFSITLIITLITGSMFGAGDIKAMAVIGLFMGLKMTYLTLVLALLIQEQIFFLMKKRQWPLAPSLGIASMFILAMHIKQF